MRSQRPLCITSDSEQAVRTRLQRPWPKYVLNVTTLLLSEKPKYAAYEQRRCAFLVLFSAMNPGFLSGCSSGGGDLPRFVSITASYEHSVWAAAGGRKRHLAVCVFETVYIQMLALRMSV